MEFAVPFLTGVGVMCAMTALLAIVMVIADATIANYGEVTLMINDDTSLKVRGGDSLLSTLKQEKVFIPSACGGRGSCGLCKLRVSGAGEALPTETPWLSAKELAESTRLCCQVRVRNDLRVAIPEELFNVTQYSAVVTSLRDLTHDIKEVRLRLENPAGMQFSAGQYIQFEVPAYERTADPVYRAYSISSNPGQPHEIELEIRLVPNGICTTYVHRHLKTGDTVTINGPYGDFQLQPGDSEVLFVAGGSGMAPVRSILLRMAEEHNPRRARYYFGACRRADLFLLDEMLRLENELPDFKFVPALSDPRPEDDWDGETGLITEVVSRHLEPAANVQAYLCGSPLMIDACLTVLTDKGIDPDQIYYDKFA